MVANAQEAVISPVYSQMSALPDEWQFSRYKLGDFRRVVETISAIAFIHALARQVAVENGCLNMGFADSIYMPSCDELLERVVSYSGIPESNVQSILDDLSYGKQAYFRSRSRFATLDCIEFNGVRRNASSLSGQIARTQYGRSLK